MFHCLEIIISSSVNKTTRGKVFLISVHSQHHFRSLTNSSMMRMTVCLFVMVLVALMLPISLDLLGHSQNSRIIYKIFFSSLAHFRIAIAKIVSAERIVSALAI